MTTESRTVYESPLGPLTITAGPRGLTGLAFPGHAAPDHETTAGSEVLAETLTQLEEYFAGERQRFELPLDLAGTPFQRAVWDAAAEIPYGDTMTYGALAREVGRLDRIRAVAAAVGRTPVPIIMPCHRLIAANGSLTGYLGGLHRKQALLDLEARVARGVTPKPAWRFRQLAML
jgi:methylated-DNA-[protein]-cysteine S-methyltransferase